MTNKDRDACGSFKHAFYLRSCVEGEERSWQNSVEMITWISGTKQTWNFDQTV